MTGEGRIQSTELRRVRRSVSVEWSELKNVELTGFKDIWGSTGGSGPAHSSWDQTRNKFFIQVPKSNGDRIHYMKASSEKTVITFSSFTPFFPHLFLVHLTGLTEISFFRVQIQVRLNHCLWTQQGEQQPEYFFLPWHVGTGYIFQALASALLSGPAPWIVRTTHSHLILQHAQRTICSLVAQERKARLS